MARQIKAEIVGDASKYQKATAAAVDSTHKFGGVLQGMAAGVGLGLFGVVANFARAIPDAIGSSISAASDLNESLNKMEVVFGESGEVIGQWSQGAAKNLGLSQQAALEAAGTFGNLFVAMGMGQPKAADMSQSLIKLAADLASFNNIDPAIALEKLRAGLTGESEPLKSLGVNLNEASIKAEAMRLHLFKGKGEITASAKAQAAYSLILQQTKTAQGDFARTSDGLANSQRINNALMKDASAKLGGFLLPVVLKVTQAFNALFTVVNERLIPYVEAHLIPAFMQIWAAAQQIWKAFMDLLAPAINYIRDNFDSIKPVLIGLGIVVGVVVGLIVLAILAVIAVVVLLVAGIISMVKTMQKGLQQVIGFWNGFVSFISGLEGSIGKAAAGMWNGIWNSFKAMINKLIRAWNALKFTVPAFDFLGQHTPSFTLGTTSIPTFEKGTGPGGLPYTGLFYGHKGETVTPAGRSRGGDIHIHIDRGAYIDGPGIDILTNRIARRLLGVTGT